MVPIFYINLATAPRRAAALDAQLAALGLGASRIEAVTPAGLAPRDIARYCDPHRYHWVHPVELACSMSHLKSWRALLATGAPYALILEDDVVLSSALPAFLAQWEGTRDLPDLARIETNLYPLRVNAQPDLKLGSIGLHRPRSSTGGSAAYLIARRCAEKLAGRDGLYGRPIDHILFDPAGGWGRRTGLVQAVPGLAVQADRLETSAVPIEASVIKPAFAARLAPVALPPLRRRWFALRHAVERDILTGSGKVWSDLTGNGKRAMDFLP